MLKIKHQFLNCHPGFISQVLTKSKIHFSSESILKISEFLDLNSAEEEILVLLLEYEKAGSQDLKKFWAKRINLLKKENLKIEKQVSKLTTELDDKSKSTYYGHWSYAVIHMMVSLKEFKNEDSIIKYLGLSRKHVRKVIDFLMSKNLIVKKEDGLSVGPTRIHLPASSNLVSLHHRNFRQLSLNFLEVENDFNLHYSSILTLSKKDCLKIKELIIQLIKDKEKILIPSPNEDILCLNLDLFKLVRDS
jgi:uncharacterized protein (TIGR02147 family)